MIDHVKRRSDVASLHVKVHLHTTPLDTERSHVLLLVAIVRFLTTDEVTFLDTSSQTSSTNNVQEIELFLPVHPATEEVTVEAKRVTRVCGVLAAESETRRHEV